MDRHYFRSLSLSNLELRKNQSLLNRTRRIYESRFLIFEKYLRTCRSLNYGENCPFVRKAGSFLDRRKRQARLITRNANYAAYSIVGSREKSFDLINLIPCISWGIRCIILCSGASNSAEWLDACGSSGLGQSIVTEVANFAPSNALLWIPVSSRSDGISLPSSFRLLSRWNFNLHTREIARVYLMNLEKIPAVFLGPWEKSQQDGDKRGGARISLWTKVTRRPSILKFPSRAYVNEPRVCLRVREGSLALADRGVFRLFACRAACARGNWSDHVLP